MLPLRVVSLRALVALVVLAACGLVGAAGAAEAAAKPRIAFSTGVITSGSSSTAVIKARVGGAPRSATIARLDRRRGAKWIALVRVRIKQQRASLAWTKAEFGAKYRLRVVLLRGRRVLVTSADKLIATKPVPKAVAPKPTSTVTPPGPTEPGIAGPIGLRLLAMGGGHGCQVTVQRTVQCWGSGGSGELGNGDTVDQPIRVDVPGLTDVSQIVAGDRHTCALQSTGAVWCWGRNLEGQLGRADAGAGSALPVKVADVGDPIALVSGPYSDTTCANQRYPGRSAPRCWGGSMSGLVGPPTLLHAPTEIQSSLDPATRITIASLSHSFFCARRAAEVRCGGSDPIEPFSPSPATVRASDHAACAVLVDVVTCSGVGGVVDPTDVMPGPGTTSYAIPGALDVANGGGAACASRASGPVLCWGADISFPGAPAQPTAMPGTDGVLSVEATGNAFCGRRGDGQVLCWGEPDHGQTGSGRSFTSLLPVPHPEGADVSTLAIGEMQGCGRGPAGVSCWGQFSWDTALDPLGPKAQTPIDGTVGAVELAVLDDAACEREGDGTVRCWGATPGGTFTADGAFDPEPVTHTATAVPDLPPVTTIVAVHDYACGLLADGSGVACWGQIGALAPAWTPGTARAPIPGTAGVVGIAGGDRLCVVDAVRTVRCAQPNGTLTAVPSISAARSVATMANIVCAATAGGTLACNTSAAVSNPQLPGLIDQLVSGGGHMCARIVDGRVACWGSNDRWQLGTMALAPVGAVVVPGITDATSLAAGGGTTCVTRAAHPATCWGATSHAIHPTLTALPDWSVTPLAEPLG